MIKFVTNDTITISTGAAFNAVSGSACFAGIRAEIVEVTEKALKIQGTTLSGKSVTAWFPLKALNVLRSSELVGNDCTHHTVTLKSWFQPNDWTRKFLAMCEDVSVLSV